MNRPDKNARVMIELELISEWSTCQRARVGSALVDIFGVVLIPARNGTPHGQPPCRELIKPDVRCPFCVHSEKNVINLAARSGTKTAGHNLFTLRRPCLGCSNDIVQADIASVYYSYDYDTDGEKEYVMDMFKRNNIYVCKLPISKEQASFRELLNKWRESW